MTKKRRIRSAYSAQASIASPNPMVENAITHISKNGLLPFELKHARVADQGCGRLRHFNLLASYFNEIYFVDTEFQLERSQRIFGKDNTITGYLRALKSPGKQFVTLTDLEFASENLRLDIVVNICALDADVPSVRASMLASARQNLRVGGLFILVIPRNDQSILKRCSSENKHLDGHVSHHHGISTFYTNYDGPKVNGLIRGLRLRGLSLQHDLSNYRQVCLITALEQ